MAAPSAGALGGSARAATRAMRAATVCCRVGPAPLDKLPGGPKTPYCRAKKSRSPGDTCAQVQNTLRPPSSLSAMTDPCRPTKTPGSRTPSARTQTRDSRAPARSGLAEVGLPASTFVVPREGFKAAAAVGLVSWAVRSRGCCPLAEVCAVRGTAASHRSVTSQP